MDGEVLLDTYYVYDNYGNLRMVLPPAASDLLTSATPPASWTETAAAIQKYAYLYKYDRLSRLKDALYGEGATLASNTNRFNEQITAYDKMGNILGLKRYGQTDANSYGLIDNLTLTYNGNQLQAVKDIATSSVYGNGSEFKDNSNQTVEYAYDKNGNLTKDLNKNISSIGYNFLNLPDQVIFGW
ncbi:hypothetical protein KGMB02408_26510 [Bacteroides faecalis]|uniref:Type IV secretion protein Rhs n=1 Tax=Bacteroides faecalis TaxID=2447885 RepID=A0A401LVZ7_9BACE|nr:hypothetical protein KGMB02408_26510 [Bacteroides faecalis]